jgi:Cu-Zn family superoxide dismutase
MKHLAPGGVVLAVLAGCASYVAPLANDPPLAAAAEVRDRTGAPKAKARVMQSGDGIRLEVSAWNMPAGAYGAHVHTTGRCDAPGFETAGGHWNPTNHLHGKDNPRECTRGTCPICRWSGRPSDDSGNDFTRLAHGRGEPVAGCRWSGAGDTCRPRRLSN